MMRAKTTPQITSWMTRFSASWPLIEVSARRASAPAVPIGSSPQPKSGHVRWRT
jgi:hypothetical protein